MVRRSVGRKSVGDECRIVTGVTGKELKFEGMGASGSKVLGGHGTNSDGDGMRNNDTCTVPDSSITV